MNIKTIIECGKMIGVVDYREVRMETAAPITIHGIIPSTNRPKMFHIDFFSNHPPQVYDNVHVFCQTIYLHDKLREWAINNILDYLSDEDMIKNYINHITSHRINELMNLILNTRVLNVKWGQHVFNFGKTVTFHIDNISLFIPDKNVPFSIKIEYPERNDSIIYELPDTESSYEFMKTIRKLVNEFRSDDNNFIYTMLKENTVELDTVCIVLDRKYLTKTIAVITYNNSRFEIELIEDNPLKITFTNIENNFKYKLNEETKTKLYNWAMNKIREDEKFNANLTDYI